MKNRSLVSGDIGCYTLGALPPLDAMDSVICMEPAFPPAWVTKKRTGFKRKSSFRHWRFYLFPFRSDRTDGCGLQSRFNTYHYTGQLDYRHDGPSGQPGAGYTLKGEPTVALEIGPICKALGVKRVREGSYDLPALEAAIKEKWQPLNRQYYAGGLARFWIKA